MKSVRRESSRRVAKIWRFLFVLAAGTGASTALLGWVEASRDTDLADPRAGVTAVALDDVDDADSPIRFSDVTEDSQIKMRHGRGPRRRLLPEDTGSGLAWGDYDGDGDWDLYVVNFSGSTEREPSADDANRLFRNDGGRFVDVTDQAGVGDAAGFGMGASFADYDDDGDADLYVTNFGPNRLFRNRGDSTFEDVAGQAGVADPSWSTGIAWGDYDRDGHLDLYVCNYIQYDARDISASPQDSAFGDYTVPYTLNPNSFDAAVNRLYHNRGDGTFEDLAEHHGVSDPDGRSFAATFCDLDGDGWLDLYVANDVSENKFFRNTLGDPPAEQFAAGKKPFVLKLTEMFGRKGGRPSAFVDLSAVTGAADPRGSMGLSVGEFGQMTGSPDGLPDLFITHWVAQENALYQSQVMPDGFLEYRDKTRELGLGEISLERVGWGCGLADFDLDGRLDLVVANGSTLERSDDTTRLNEEPMFVFWNDGDQFRNVAAAAGLTAEYSARGLALADYDGDGDVDLAVSVNRGAPLLIRNETPTKNKSLQIRLCAPAALCFGAKVEVTVADGVQTQWCGGDVSYLSMHSAELTFGLGTATTAKRVEVTWANGSKTRRTHVPAGVCEIATGGFNPQKNGTPRPATSP